MESDSVYRFFYFVNHLRKLHIILASRSPRRKKLFQQLGLHFKVVPSVVPEQFDRKQTPRKNAERIALEKALDVAQRSSSGIVVGADTIVVLGRKILGKPRNASDAKRMLGLLSGKRHDVITGVAIIDTVRGRKRVFSETTKVLFRKLQDGELAEYVRTGSPLDKAGGYGIQDDYGAVFVEKVEGCFYNVVGFPVTRFYQELTSFVQG
ncbi:MAG: septum formation protein Maf [Ignavibacteriales bacterium]|nr:septum formation protein Maf [Ignavibacteriales bacterium]